jgi:lipopolysaccharide export system permease protein
LKEAHEMYSAAQLLVKADSLKLKYDEYVKSRADNFYLRIGGNKLYKSDSAKISNLEPEILDNFELKEKVIVLDNAIQSSNRSIDNLVNGRDTFKNNRKALNMFDIEFFNRISFSFACLVLFFIGAPLGSIIRKGGFGIPMVLGITIFVVYFFISTFGKNMAEESSIPAILGSALSTIILLPVGIFLTLRATKDKGRIDIDLIFDRVVKYFHKFAKQKNLTE